MTVFGYALRCRCPAYEASLKIDIYPSEFLHTMVPYLLTDTKLAHLDCRQSARTPDMVERILAQTCGSRKIGSEAQAPCTSL